jgi:hypothetical protein
MVTVEADNSQIRVTIPTRDLSPEEVSTFVAWVRLESTAWRSRLTPDAARRLSEDVKSDWWKANAARFGERA